MTLFLHEPQRKNEIPNGKAHCWMYLSRFVQVNLPHPPKYFINTPSASVSSKTHSLVEFFRAWLAFLGRRTQWTLASPFCLTCCSLAGRRTSYRCVAGPCVDASTRPGQDLTRGGVQSVLGSRAQGLSGWPEGCGYLSATKSKFYYILRTLGLSLNFWFTICCNLLYRKKH